MTNGRFGTWFHQNKITSSVSIISLLPAPARDTGLGGIGEGEDEREEPSESRHTAEDTPVCRRHRRLVETQEIIFHFLSTKGEASILRVVCTAPPQSSHTRHLLLLPLPRFSCERPLHRHARSFIQGAKDVRPPSVCVWGGGVCVRGSVCVCAVCVCAVCACLTCS